MNTSGSLVESYDFYGQFVTVVQHYEVRSPPPPPPATTVRCLRSSCSGLGATGVHCVEEGSRKHCYKIYPPKRSTFYRVLLKCRLFTGHIQLRQDRCTLFLLPLFVVLIEQKIHFPFYHSSISTSTKKLVGSLTALVLSFDFVTLSYFGCLLCCIYHHI